LEGEKNGEKQSNNVKGVNSSIARPTPKVKKMVDMSASSRKRARCLSIENIGEDEISVGEDDGTMPAISLDEEPEEDEEHESDDFLPKVPKGFLCPLTLETMFDPVLDAEGNTYERYAILEWLKEHRTSPISRQHLSERMLKPNNSLREAIHEFMGSAWVQNMTAEQKLTKRSLFRHQRNRGMSSLPGGAAPLDSSSSHSREKIDCFLQFTFQKIGGLDLCLNNQGCCAFQYDGITAVLDVPVKAGVFCLYTRNLVTDLTDAMKDLLLELNFLQGKSPFFSKQGD
jgi:U-box domain